MERRWYGWLQAGLALVVGFVPLGVIIRLGWHGWWAVCLAVVLGALFAFLVGWAMEVRRHDKKTENANVN